MGKTVESFRMLWRERLTVGVALQERCVSPIGKLLMSLWICAGTLRRAAMLPNQ